MGITAWVRRAALQPTSGDGSAPEPATATPAPSEAEQTPPAPERLPPTPGAPVTGSDTAAEAAPCHAPAGGNSDVEALEWPELEAAVRDCQRCPLHETRTQGVFGVGNRRADLLIIGEAPGAEEDRRGEPFVGRAGGLLDVMLGAIGLDRGSVYITNILKSRPPDNRDPRAEEVAACEPYLKRQIELIEPRAILAVGRVAAQNLLDTSQPLGKLRGRWHQYGPQRTPVRVSYHPAYLLRRPHDKGKAWQDLKLIREAIAG